MKKNSILYGFISIAICLTVGFIGSISTQSSIKTWYPTIVKPFFNPPNWVFAPVWTLLFILMGLAFAIIWSSENQKDKSLKKKAMILFVIQLLLNLLWSILFFGLCNPFLAFLEIILLWLFIYETIKAFAIIDKLSAKLMYPYLAWVTFASILNGTIWFLNS